MQQRCANCNHACHCHFESYSTYPYNRYHSFLNPCTNKTIDDLQTTKRYVQRWEIKLSGNDQYYPSITLENKIIKIDESDYVDKTFATHRIDRVKTGTHIEYEQQKTTGWVGNKRVEFTSQVPTQVDTISDVYVPTEGKTVKMIAIWQNIVNECKCNKCICGSQAASKKLVDEAKALKPKETVDKNCCCIIL